MALMFTDQSERLKKYRTHLSGDLNWASILADRYDHSKIRASERYKIVLTPGEWEKLNWLVFREAYPATFLHVQDQGTTVYEIDYEPRTGRKRTVKVFFDERALCISSFIPMEHNKPLVSVWSDLLQRRRQIRYEWGQAKAAEIAAKALKPASSSSPFGVLANVRLSTPVETTVESSRAILKLPPPVEPAKSAAATSKPGLIVTMDNAPETARNLWKAIQGEWEAKGEIVKVLTAGLRAEQKRNEPRQEPDEGTLVARLLDKPLSKLGGVKIPICGVGISVGEVFRMAEVLDHPMNSHCREFIGRNRLYLRSIAGQRGKPSTVVMQKAA